ncbi:MAG: S-layer homology domain-containing protein [Oscillospiraceae bacterium]
MKYAKKLICTALSVILLLSLTSGPALADGTDGPPAFSDLPSSGWAREAITAAYSHGLMEGVGDGFFGTGRTITRAEFITVLVRMFGWTASASEDSFSDISGSWARDYINTAVSHGVVDAGGKFRPADDITRREMAVMLVRALGYGDVAKAAADYSIPFTDVNDDRGYIVVAYDIGMTNGTSDTTFSPERTSTREETAAMLVRIYEKYISSTEWTHAFYAISSYSQIELAKQFDAVSLGWSRMVYDGASAPRLNTTTSGGNEYYIPSGYASVITELEGADVKLHLSVYMDRTSSIDAMLSSQDARSQAISAIMAELTRTYPELGRNPYSGVTIDFEGLRSASRDNFTAFLSELDSRLEENGMTLYVTVAPATADGIYYDGYDYRAIGNIADKVILMAHDYAAKNLDGFLNSSYYKNTALTPINSVYYSLRAACDETTGVQDVSKLTLAISLSSLAWETDENGLLTSTSPLQPTHTTIYKRLTGGAVMGWSESSRNPYLTYETESGQHIFLWYEDSRSVEAKVSLAKLFGVNSVSVWRLGLIPCYSDESLYYNVMDAVK